MVTTRRGWDGGGDVSISIIGWLRNRGPRALGAWIRSISSFLVGKKIEVRMLPGAGHVLAGDADERSGEARQTGGVGFVGEYACVELLRQPLPVAAVEAPSERKALVIDFHPQFHGLPGRNHNGRSERVSLRRVGQRGHDAQVFAQSFV